MSLFKLDDILETDRFVLQEFFELSMNEPDVSQEMQARLNVLTGGDSIDFDHNYS